MSHSKSRHLRPSTENNHAIDCCWTGDILGWTAIFIHLTVQGTRVIVWVRRFSLRVFSAIDDDLPIMVYEVWSIFSTTMEYFHNSDVAFLTVQAAIYSPWWISTRVDARWGKRRSTSRRRSQTRSLVFSETLDTWYGPVRLFLPCQHCNTCLRILDPRDGSPPSVHWDPFTLMDVPFGWYSVSPYFSYIQGGVCDDQQREHMKLCIPDFRHSEHAFLNLIRQIVMPYHTFSSNARRRYVAIFR